MVSDAAAPLLGNRSYGLWRVQAAPRLRAECRQAAAKLEAAQQAVCIAWRSRLVRWSTAAKCSSLLSTEAELALVVRSAKMQHWVYARGEALARMKRYAKMAIEAGVADRQTANAEHLGAAVGRHLTRLAGTLVKTPRELR
jgi:hypothetical protein